MYIDWNTKLNGGVTWLKGSLDLACMQGGLRPHAFCLPILKREEHRAAVLAAATSGSPKFFLGTDSAPHPKASKVRAVTALYCCVAVRC